MTKRKTIKLVKHAFDQDMAHKEVGTEFFQFMEIIMQRFLILTDSPDEYSSNSRQHRYNRRVIFASIIKLIQFWNVLRFAISALVNKVRNMFFTRTNFSIKWLGVYGV